MIDFNDYKYLYLDANVLRPTEKARIELKIPEYWDFYMTDLGKIIDDNESGLKDISEVVFELSKDIHVKKKHNPKQDDYLIELISIIKKLDTKINWQSTDKLIGENILWAKFRNTDIYKNIQKKYLEVEDIFVGGSMNDTIKCAKEAEEAFKIWKKSL